MLDLNADTAGRSRAYRAFKLDRAGRVYSAEVVPAEDDGQARRRARAMVQYDVIELWERTRFLGRFEPGAQSQAHLQAHPRSEAGSGTVRAAPRPSARSPSSAG